MFPKKFNKEEYVKWHENHFKEDIDLNDKIIKQRAEFKTSLKDDLTFITELFYFLIPAYQKDYKIQYEAEFDFKIPLKNALSEYPNKSYELLFKSTDSIINKLWRKNKDLQSINLSNLKENINDLVRTEINISTLSACRFIAKKLSLQNISLPSDSKLKKQLDERVENIEFEPEMKMASGYFAYHGTVKLKNGHSIEVQIYSNLMGNWRKLSHKLYERVRLNPTTKHDFGTSESRLISLGHLLHLAECEVERLEQEIK